MDNADFTMIPNSIINDKSLSLRAKALYIVLLSNSKNWEINLQEISSRSVESFKVHKEVVNELIKVGLVKRTAIKNEVGKFAKFAYEIIPDQKVHDVKTVPWEISTKSDTFSEETSNFDKIPKVPKPTDGQMVPWENDVKSDTFDPKASKFDVETHGTKTHQWTLVPYNKTNVNQNKNNNKEDKEDENVNVNVNTGLEDSQIPERSVLSFSDFSSLETSLPLKNVDFLSKLNNQPIALFLDNMLKKFPSYIQNEIWYLLKGIQTFLQKYKQRNLELDDAKFLYDLFIRESDEDVFYVCITYNGEDIHGTHGLGYIKGIMEKHKSFLQTRNNPRVENERNKSRELHKQSLDRYAAQLEASNLSLGTKIACGLIEGNVSLWR